MCEKSIVEKCRESSPQIAWLRYAAVDNFHWNIKWSVASLGWSSRKLRSTKTLKYAQKKREGKVPTSVRGQVKYSSSMEIKYGTHRWGWISCCLFGLCSLSLSFWLNFVMYIYIFSNFFFYLASSWVNWTIFSLRWRRWSPVDVRVLPWWRERRNQLGSHHGIGLCGEYERQGGWDREWVHI